MNHRIFKLLRLLGAPLLAAAAVFGSCTTELESNEFSPGGGNGKGEQEVLLKLHVPGTTKPGEKGGTRAVNKKEEDEIDDLYVLAFKAEADESKDAYEYWVSAKKGGNNATWTAALKVRDYNQRFIVIANAIGANPNLTNVIQGLKLGTLKPEIKQLLTVTLTDTEKRPVSMPRRTTTIAPLPCADKRNRLQSQRAVISTCRLAFTASWRAYSSISVTRTEAAWLILPRRR